MKFETQQDISSMMDIFGNIFPDKSASYKEKVLDKCKELIRLAKIGKETEDSMSQEEVDSVLAELGDSSNLPKGDSVDAEASLNRESVENESEVFTDSANNEDVSSLGT